MSKVAIIGSHGLYANYGGWDQLVINLAEINAIKGANSYEIYQSRDANKNFHTPKGTKVIHMPLKASGFEGLFYDWISILMSYFVVDALLMLGIQGSYILPVLRIFKKQRIICNIGGIEWERDKFSFVSKLFLRGAFWLTIRYADVIILDNEYYRKFIPGKYMNKIRVISYGGFIDESIQNLDKMHLDLYPFLEQKYFLSISRAIEDNKIEELIKAFLRTKRRDVNMVIISNFSSSVYGRGILSKYSDLKNLFLIDGLYDKPLLDYIRRNAILYVHTHTKCGSAPSLIEMIHTDVPILYRNVSQNKFTMKGEGYEFSDQTQCEDFLRECTNYVLKSSSNELKSDYLWASVIDEYEQAFINR